MNGQTCYFFAGYYKKIGKNIKRYSGSWWKSTDGLDDTTITAEAKYSVNITNSIKKICLSLFYNAANSFFVF